MKIQEAIDLYETYKKLGLNAEINIKLHEGGLRNFTITLDEKSIKTLLNMVKVSESDS